MALYLGFVLGTGYSCGHYRGVVVAGHIGMGGVQFRLVVAALSRDGSRIVGHDDLRDSAEVLQIEWPMQYHDMGGKLLIRLLWSTIAVRRPW